MYNHCKTLYTRTLRPRRDSSYDNNWYVFSKRISCFYEPADKISVQVFRDAAGRSTIFFIPKTFRFENFRDNDLFMYKVQITLDLSFWWSIKKVKNKAPASRADQGRFSVSKNGLKLPARKIRR